MAVLCAAAALGVSGELEDEFEYSQQAALSAMRANVPHLADAGFRWIGEMEEIAASFEHAGGTPRFHLGAADVFTMLSETPFAAENPETADASRTLEETIEVIARSAAEPASER